MPSNREKWLDPNYKLNKEEIKQAKKEIADFTRNDKRRGVRNGVVWGETPEEVEKGKEIQALQNKINPVAAFASGVLGKIPSLISAAAKGLAASGSSDWISDEQKEKAVNDIEEARQYANAQSENMRTQNPIANLAGNFAGTALQYGAVNGALEGTAAANALTERLGEHGANLVLGEAADIALDTIPTEVENYQNGMRGTDLATDTLKNLGVNAAFNLGAEGLGMIPELLKNRKAAQEAAETAAKSAPIEETAENTLKQLEPVTEPEPIKQLNPVDLAARNAEVEELAYRQQREAADAIGGLREQIPAEPPVQPVLEGTERQTIENLTNTVNPENTANRSALRELTDDIINTRNTQDLVGNGYSEAGQAYMKNIDRLMKQETNLLEQAEKSNDPAVKQLYDEVLSTGQDYWNNVTQVNTPINPDLINTHRQALENLENYMNNTRQSLTDSLNGLEIEKGARKGIRNNLKTMDGIAERIKTAQSAEEVNSILSEAEKMAGDTEALLKKSAQERMIKKGDFDEPTQAFVNALNGKKIYLSPEVRANFTDMNNINDFGNQLYFNGNGGRFKPAFRATNKDAIAIDQLFPEIDRETGHALSNFMKDNGLNPGNAADQVRGLLDYGNYLKSNKDSLKVRPYEGGVLDDFMGNLRKAAEDKLNTFKEAVTPEPRLKPNLQFFADKANDLEKEISNMAEGAEKEQLKGALNDFRDSLNSATTKEEAERAWNTLQKKRKISKTYSNTLTNSNVMTEAERKEWTVPEWFAYEEKAEKETTAKAIQLLNEEGVENFVKTRLTKEGFTAEDTDGMMLAWKDKIEEARKLEEEGKDAAILWNQANTIFRKIQQEGTRGGQAIQALAKWSRNTPEGMLLEAERIVNKNISPQANNSGLTGLTSALKNKINKGIDKSAVAKQKPFMDECVSAYKDFADRLRKSFDASEYGGKTDNIHKLDDAISQFEEAINNGDIKRIADTYSALKTRANSMVKKGLTLNVNTKDVDDAIKSLVKNSRAGGFEFSPEFQKDFINEASKIQDLEPNSREFKEAYARLGQKINDEIRRNTPIPKRAAQMFTTYLMDNMLGNFRTLITRNAGGNVGLAAAEQFLERPLAAGIDRLVAKKTGMRTQAGLSRRALADYVSGFKKGLSEEWQDLRKGLHTGRTGEVNLKNAIEQNGHIFKTDSKILPAKVISKFADGADGLVRHGLSVGDRPFYEANYKQTLGDLKQLRSQGVLGEAIQNLPEKQFNEYAEAAAKLNALTAVYQNDSQMSEALLGFKKSISDLSEATLGVDILSQFTMPFVKTPANVVDRAIDYSPIGVVRNIVRTAKEGGIGGHNQNRFVNETARNIIGTGLMTGAGVAASKGALSGKYSTDPDQKKAQKESGMQEYALNIPVGDDTYQQDISWIPIIGSNAVASAAAVEAAKDSDLSPVDKTLAGVKGGGKAMLEQSFFQGLQRLFGQGDSYDSDEGIVGNMINTVKSGATQAVPSLARQVAQVADPYERDLSNGDYDINNIKNTLPGLRQSLQPKVDTEGEYVKQNQGRNVGMKILEDMILPGKITKVEAPELTAEAQRLQGLTGNNYAYQPKASKKDITTDYYEPTPEEYTQYQVERNKAMTSTGKELLKSSYYKSATPKQQEAMLQNMYQGIKDYAKAGYTGEEVEKKVGVAYNVGKEKDAVKEIIYHDILSNYGLSDGDAYRKIYQNEGEAALKEYAEYKAKENNYKRSHGLESMTKDDKMSVLRKESLSTQKKLLPDMLTSQEDKERWEAAGHDVTRYWKLYDAAQNKKAADEKAVQNTIKSAGIGDAEQTQKELASYGAIDSPKTVEYYAKAKQVIPSLTTKEYTGYLHDIGGSDYKIEQKEFLAYANKNKLPADKVNNYWKAFGNWKTIPKLVKGQWKAAKK